MVSARETRWGMGAEAGNYRQSTLVYENRVIIEVEVHMLFRVQHIDTEVFDRLIEKIKVGTAKITTAEYQYADPVTHPRLSKPNSGNETH